MIHHIFFSILINQFMICGFMDSRHGRIALLRARYAKHEAILQLTLLYSPGSVRIGFRGGELQPPKKVPH